MMDYLNAFWVGGLICALVQILLEKTKMLPGRVMVLLVCLGAVISFFGWYEPLMEYAGAGVSVPLLGYGNILMKGVKEAVAETFAGLPEEAQEIFQEAMGITFSVGERQISVKESVFFLLLYACIAIGIAGALNKSRKLKT